MTPVKSLVLVLLAGFAGLPQIARAQDAWYAGLDVGRSEADASISEFTVGTPATRGDGSDLGFRLRLGYQFTDYFEAEVGYADFGDFELDFDPEFCPIGVPEPCPFSTRTSINGWFVSVVGRFPIGDHWALYASAGWFRLDVDIGELGAGGIDDSEKMDGLQTGFGVGYRVTDHWELLLDYNKYEQIELGLTVGSAVGVFSFGDTRLTSLGVNYRW